LLTNSSNKLTKDNSDKGFRYKNIKWLFVDFSHIPRVLNRVFHCVVDWIYFWELAFLEFIWTFFWFLMLENILDKAFSHIDFSVNPLYNLSPIQARKVFPKYSSAQIRFYDQIYFFVFFRSLIQLKCDDLGSNYNKFRISQISNSVT